MTSQEAEAIINLYGAALARSTDGGIARKLSWLPCSVELIRLAYLIYLREVIARSTQANLPLPELFSSPNPHNPRDHPRSSKKMVLCGTAVPAEAEFPFTRQALDNFCPLSLLDRRNKKVTTSSFAFKPEAFCTGSLEPKAISFGDHQRLGVPHIAKWKSQ
jgi:hypothetical protein